MTHSHDNSSLDLPATQAILTIDLAALADNWRLLRNHAPQAECGAVVKANAYGIGIEPAVRTLAAAGCRTFFVAHLSEGARVRAELDKSGHRRSAEGFSIYALNGLLPDKACAQECAAAGIKPVIGSLAELQAWVPFAKQSQTAFALHFNTGMNRLGIETSEAKTALDMMQASCVAADLIMSHFVSSEEQADPQNIAQIAAFETLRTLFPQQRASLANSSGILLPQKPHYDLIRPGYALYGGNPLPGQPNPMKPVVNLQAPIIQLRTIEAGETVGYNAQWTAKRRTRLAAIGVGYADGFPRAAMATDAKPGAQALVGGIICPFAGRVSMDLIVIDVTDVQEAALVPGVCAELLGGCITIDDLGIRSGTIGYEILTGLGRRYHRRYVEAVTSARA